MSKTFIRKNRKGVKNYLLYKQLHQMHGLGSFYYINYLFLIALTSFSVLFILSPIKWMRAPIIITAVILGLIEIPAIFKALVYINREEVGRSFVFFDVVKRYNGRSRHFVTVLDWLFCILPLGIYLLLTIKLFF